MFLTSPFAFWFGTMINLSGSNYPCLEQISMVPKMFKQLRFDCYRKKKRKKDKGGGAFKHGTL